MIAFDYIKLIRLHLYSTRFKFYCALSAFYLLQLGKYLGHQRRKIYSLDTRLKCCEIFTNLSRDSIWKALAREILNETEYGDYNPKYCINLVADGRSTKTLPDPTVLMKFHAHKARPKANIRSAEAL